MSHARLQRLCAASLLILCAIRSTPAQAPGDLEVLIIASPEIDVDRWRELDPELKAARLRGAENDARMIADLARYRHGAAAKSIRIVGLPGSTLLREFDCTEQFSTRETVYGELDRFARRVGAGRRGVAYFTGHGGRIEDPGRAGTRRTEFFVLRNGPLFDFEMDHILSEAQGRITQIIDACHGPDLARGPGLGQSKFLRFSNGGRLSAVARLMERRKQELRIPPGGLPELPPDGRRMVITAVDTREEALVIPVEGVSPQSHASAFTLALYRSAMRSGRRNYFQLKADLTRELTLLGVSQAPQIMPARGSDLFVGEPSASEGHYPTSGNRMRVGALCGIRPGSEVRSASGERFEVRSADLFEAQLAPLTPGSTAPGGVEVTARAASRLAMRPARIRKGVGEDPPEVDLRDAEGIEVVVDGRQAQAVRLFQRTSAGQFGPVREVPTAGADAAAGSLATAYGAADALFRSLTSMAATQKRVFGLDISTQKPGVLPRFGNGDIIDIHAETEQPGYLMLLALDPDGSIAVLYPNVSGGKLTQYRVPRGRPFQLNAVPPPGLTRLCALVTAGPIELPDELLERPRGYASFLIPPDRVPAFVHWIHGRLAGGRSRGTAVREDLLVPADSVEVAVLQYVVQ